MPSAFRLPYNNVVSDVGCTSAVIHEPQGYMYPTMRTGGTGCLLDTVMQIEDEYLSFRMRVFLVLQTNFVLSRYLR